MGEPQKAPPPPASTFGDERIARDHSLAVTIEARRRLDELQREDEMFGRPRRTFTAEALEEIYEAAGDKVRTRQRTQAADSEPIGPVLAEFKAIADRIVAARASLPCHGYVEDLRFCTSEVEETCADRTANWCPRQIVRLRRSLRRSQGLPATPQERLERLGVPEEIAVILTGGLDHRGRLFDGGLAAIRRVATFLEDPDAVHLVLAGGNGVGKSVAAAWALKDQPGRFVSSYRLSEHAKDLPWLARMIEEPLLVVDDLGSEDLSEASKAAANRLAYERGGKRTIWTWNTTRQVLEARYDARFVDRVATGNHSWVVAGESMR